VTEATGLKEQEHEVLLLDFLNAEDPQVIDPPALFMTAEARVLRAYLRQAIAEGRAAAPSAAGIPLVAVLDPEGRPGLASNHALGPVAIAAVRMVFEGRWERLKLCGDDDCRWAFVDASRNRAGRWCDMATCGNRAKSRAFRARQKSDGE
jgi:predicted RNA-binding Zn ribbon-like protein